MLASLPKLDDAASRIRNRTFPQQPAYCKNETRSIKPNLWVAVGICTHLGCSPTFRPELAPADLGGRLARRVLLSVPPIEVRPGRTGVQGRARADEPRRFRRTSTDRYAVVIGEDAKTARSACRSSDDLRNGTRMSKLMTWIDDRFPLTALWNSQWGKYVAPKNFNFWYYFGSLAAFVLVLQIVTGIWLTMNYKPDAAKAFESVEYIMRDVQWGWLIRYMHSTGASMFFIVVYLHMFRGLMYGSYRKPRELTWIFGCLIYLALMAEAFFGYLLPWGQMSYWGAQVIVNLFSTIPVIGEDLALWIRGDYTISDITLNRFFAFHVIALPLVLLGLVAAHLMALHETGSNNPDGVEIKKQPKDPATGLPLDGIYSHPYYTVKDIVGVIVFLACSRSSCSSCRRWAATSSRRTTSFQPTR